jgi:hypothetical protein
MYKHLSFSLLLITGSMLIAQITPQASTLPAEQHVSQIAPQEEPEGVLFAVEEDEQPITTETKTESKDTVSHVETKQNTQSIVAKIETSDDDFATKMDDLDKEMKQLKEELSTLQKESKKETTTDAKPKKVISVATDPTEDTQESVSPAEDKSQETDEDVD